MGFRFHIQRHAHAVLWFCSPHVTGCVFRLSGSMQRKFVAPYFGTRPQQYGSHCHILSTGTGKYALVWNSHPLDNHHQYRSYPYTFAMLRKAYAFYALIFYVLVSISSRSFPDRRRRNLPLWAIEILPVSSDTIIAMASDS